MKIRTKILISACVVIAGLISVYALNQSSTKNDNMDNLHNNQEAFIDLPEASQQSKTSIEEALAKRRSVRSYKNESLSLSQISQLLWAAQGITDETTGFRTAPSAGALYPMETYLIVSNVENLETGVYKYTVKNHGLKKIKSGEYGEKLASAALGQSCIKQASAIIVFSAVYDRITQKYGERGIRYAHMEAGHAAQNVYLQSTALDIGTVVVGAFDDENVEEVVEMEENETALYILPVGKI